MRPGISISDAADLDRLPRGRLARQPRWTLRFTPTSASRLNAVEEFSPS
jgi:hypothetical protein